MKVCLISREYPPETAWGGIATYTHTLAHGLAKAGHRVHVVSLSLDKEEYIHYDGPVTVHRIRPVRWFLPLGYLGFPTVANMLNHSIRVAQKLREVYLQEPFDVVEAPEYFAEGLVYGLSPYTPLVVHLHMSLREILTVSKTELSLESRLACWLEEAVVKRATRIVANSRFSAQRAPSMYDVPSSKVTYVYPAVECPYNSSPDVDNKILIHQPMVLFCGRLSQRKGTETLLESIPKVLKELPDVKFIIAGKDRPSAPGGRFYRQYFDECIADRQSRYAVVWKGFANGEELHQLYKDCDIFVAPSLYETFGFVHLEAMAHGKPVVACRAGATPEVVVDGETGILIEPGNSDELAKAIIRLLSDADLRRRMGQAALTRARQFTVEAMVEKTLAVYRRAIEEFSL